MNKRLESAGQPRRHRYEEERRTRKLRRLVEKLDASIGTQTVEKILAETAKTLENNQSYQNWKNRN